MKHGADYRERFRAAEEETVCITTKTVDGRDHHLVVPLKELRTDAPGIVQSLINVRLNLPMVCAFMRVKGTPGAKQVVWLDRDTCTLRLEGETDARPWSECEYG